MNIILSSNDNVVDWNVNQLNKETNESHDGNTNDCGEEDFVEF